VLSIGGLELVTDGEGFTVGAVVGREGDMDESALVVTWLAVCLEVVSFKVLISDCLLLGLRFLQPCGGALIETIYQGFLPLFFLLYRLLQILHSWVSY
jgi:hypothetical protein